MDTKNLKYLLISALALTFNNGSVFAADTDTTNLSSQWDSALSSLLLAAGMYGLDTHNSDGLDLSLSQSTNMLKGVSSELGSLDNRNITLSYSGSSGKLGFSAGYIYTSLQNNLEPDTILVDLDSLNHNPLANTDPWYLSLNLSRSFQVSDSIALGVGSQAMLMKTPHENQEGRILSMLLNLPVSYKNYFTITPELQWSRSLPDATTLQKDYLSNHKATEEEDIFYGGMSISFSY